MEEAPLQRRGSIGTVERYNAPLGLDFEKISPDMGRKVTYTERPKIAVFAVNSTGRLDDSFLMMIVFGAIPKLARISLSPFQFYKAKEIDWVSLKVGKEQKWSVLEERLAHTFRRIET